MSGMDAVVRELAKMEGDPARLERTSFDTYEGEEGTETLIATYEAPNPMVFRHDRPIRFVLTAFEEFTSDGSGETQEFELSHDLVESPQSADVRVYADGEKVKPESIDYDTDTIEYADGGEEEEVVVHYIAGDDAEVTIRKEAPSSQGSVSQSIFDAPLALLHQRDQDEQPRSFDEGRSPLERVVPTDWKINIYVDAPYKVALYDEDTGTTARNAVLSLPYKQAQQDVEGLGQAVAHDVIQNS